MDMEKSAGILALSCLFHLFAFGQVEKEGTAVLKNGDTLRGLFHHEEDRLFAGVEFLGPGRDGEALYLTADTLRSLDLEGDHFRSILIEKAEAGTKSRSLAVRKKEGPMDLYEGRYRYRSCSCQDYASIRKGAFILKEEEEKLYLVQKNRFLDRIKNADAIAPAFLPFDDLMEAVRDRDYSFSGIGRAVERFNDRSKDPSEP